LQHTAGWDRDKSGDPMFMAEQIARACNVGRPPDARTIIRYMLGRPLDFDPGARHVYSNFGYCVLGRIIEQVTGQPYEAWLKQDVLEPIGIKTMRIGRSLAKLALPGEVRYHMEDDQQSNSVFDGLRGKVPTPYGSFHLEAMDAHGGWIASAVDLMRLVVAMERPQNPLLSPEMFKELITPPAAPVARKSDGTVEAAYYGCGWMVRPIARPAGVNLWHGGSLPGTNTLLVRLSSGTSWVALFNQRREKKGLPDGEIDGALHRAARAVREWPSQDLFANFSR
jgi:N-acyl-D-amino-acid deacylase